ncbi:hypothetical protein MLD38_031646 [Melastoma candidum]|uniref:Uncharacterized protein n=1 Tax=Melastoma candidum TaxID=119954 RepID=A0ACB9MPX6_9MYRT|nr:hypothetical protein MLD38_031646 [Melastoma candidum]
MEAHEPKESAMEIDGEEENELPPLRAAPSLFPSFGVSSASSSPAAAAAPSSAAPVPQWLSNSSFTADASTINSSSAAAFSGGLPAGLPDSDDEDERGDDDEERGQRARVSYEMVESSESDREMERRRKKKRRRRKTSGVEDNVASDRKASVRVWADSGVLKPSKEYFVDLKGDRDNLAFGSLYRMDVARYKPYNSEERFGLEFRGMHRQSGSVLETDGDIDAQDSKLKSAGRYWAAKYAAFERNKTYKHLRVIAPVKSSLTLPGSFVPLMEEDDSNETVDGVSAAGKSLLEESWEDEVLRRTRDFNKMTREQPRNGKVWIEFAEFQDKVASKQPQKGARLQTLEKKIGILEKANELNPENEELLLLLLKSYQRRDSGDALVGRWKKILVQHSGSCRLWKEFLRLLQSEFSRFKVSDMRKMYSHAIQALSSACVKQSRQLHSNEGSQFDHSFIEMELGLVDIFMNLCRLEWQAGYRELATALLQAEIEFGLFCPPLLLTESSKQRLFEHFWNSGAARVGEEGALGWSIWLEKEEEERERTMKEDSLKDNDEGGWTGWFIPTSKPEEIGDDAKEINNEAVDHVEDEMDDGNPVEDDDPETLLKMLGVDVDAGLSVDVKDNSTWNKWSKEELQRDFNQWLPVHAKADKLLNENDERDEEEQLVGVILYEDVYEHLFSISSEEARLSLVSQFIDFFSGKISHRVCSNSPTWIEKTLSAEDFSDSILLHLRDVSGALMRAQSSSVNCHMEVLLNNGNKVYRGANMMVFLRNAILLCLAIFPRNYILEEAVLMAEELSHTSGSTSIPSVTPCRTLAKNLLKKDRQDILFCGIYAQREAAFQNIDHARKVFDMALGSIEVLPVELQNNAPLLYFWYAQTELNNNSGNYLESSHRALHILTCLGSGVAFSPYKCQPSNLQVLRARQGFKEKLKATKAMWMRSLINDQTVALICASALFEELTSGSVAGIEILKQAFGMVLPEGRRYSYQLEMLYNYLAKMLQRRHPEFGLSKIWDSVMRGLEIYPFSPELLSSLVRTSSYASPYRLRCTFDDLCHRHPSVVVWVFALEFEMAKGGSEHRIHGLFERALTNDTLRSSVLLWRSYIAYEIDVAQNPSSAKRIFFRAIHACPWSKRLWLEGFLKLSSVLTAKELSDLQEVMRDKELNIRTDIYEILLQDETPS